MRINLDVDLYKIITAYSNYEMLLKGYYTLRKSNDERFNEIVTPDAILVFRNFWVDIDALNSSHAYDFLCGYTGSGPRRLVRFLNEKTDEEERFLKRNVFKHDFIEYDFNKKEMTSYNSKYKYGFAPFDVMLRNDNTFVFFVNGLGRTLREIRFGIIETVLKIYNFCEELFREETISVKKIHYIGDKESEEWQYYQLESEQPSSDAYNLIIDCGHFEIWINFPFHDRKQKNICFSDEFKEVLHQLGIQLKNPNYQSELLKIVDRINMYFGGKQENQTIVIE